MTTLQFADTHNLVAFMAKPAESEGFKQVVDFLNASSIRYALTFSHYITYSYSSEQFSGSVSKNSQWGTGVKPSGMEVDSCTKSREMGKGSAMHDPHHHPSLLNFIISTSTKKKNKILARAKERTLRPSVRVP
ncbi:hypothetical protein Tco_0665324 [Tanacetum coccineum]